MRNSPSLTVLLDDSMRLNQDRTAVTDATGHHDYARLNRMVDAVASGLVARGCRQGTRVCLAVSHGVELVAAVLAVLKVGATYVPLDTRDPVDRIAYIVEDSSATMIVYSKEHGDLATEFALVRLCVNDVGADGPVETRAVSPSDLAYILYTSGSTGKPKGVGITHENLLNYVSWARDRYIRSKDDRIALYTTMAFDFTVTCVFPPLLAGASIGVHDGLADPLVMQRILADQEINVIKITPSYLHVLSHMLAGQRHLARLIVGGEDLKAELAVKVHRQLGTVEIINEYGPTEATVGCVTHTFDPETDTGTSVAIGLPIPGMHAYVLDEDGNPAEEGELCLAGRGVARGYLNSTARSRAVFVDNPCRPGTAMYRTGDLVRRDRNGELVFVARLDDQVKIRGHRVELAEVSTVISSHPMVTSTYVTTVFEHGANTLVAVVTGEDGLTPVLLLAYLASQLPAYAIPTSLEVMEEIPLTLNQKADRAAVLTALGKARSLTTNAAWSHGSRATTRHRPTWATP